MKIFAIGNSHVNIFSGKDTASGSEYEDMIPYFRTKHIGPTIAYNFYENHYPKVLNFLNTSNIDKQKDYVCLVVGEVDCRWHLLKQANIQNKNIDDVVKECATRFFRCLLDLKKRGYNVLSWGCHPTTTAGHNNNPGMPIYGDCYVRNNVVVTWNSYIKKFSDDNQIKFISIYNYLIDDNNITLMDYFLDYCHLKTTKVLPLLYTEMSQLNLLPKFTFGIITSGDQDTRLNIIIDSIRRQNIPEYEIIIIGNSSLSGEYIKVIPFDENQKPRWITKKKNLITETVQYENIVYMHDYIKLDDNWYSGWIQYGDDFKACMNKIVNPDGSRYRDWTLYPNLPEVEDGLYGLLPYTETRLSKYMYFSGCYWVAKKSVMTEFPLDETKSWGQGEDVQWSNQIKEKYNFSINSESAVVLLKYKDPIFQEMTEEMHKSIICKCVK